MEDPAEGLIEVTILVFYTIKCRCEVILFLLGGESKRRQTHSLPVHQDKSTAYLILLLYLKIEISS